MKLIVIGSSGSSHIILNSPYVSSYHAELILLDDGDILLEDKGSRNGTFYKDNRLQPNNAVTIKRGENVRFANMALDWNLVPKQDNFDKNIKEIRSIGTNFRNRYQLHGDRVSRFHATYKKYASGKWYICDHSTNGTTVNGTVIPKEQDFYIKKRDVILCAGVVVPNPYGEDPIDRKIIFRVAVAILLIIVISLGIKHLFTNPGPWTIPWPEKELTDNEIYEKYKTSVALLFAGYYYEVSAGDLDFSLFKMPTKVIVSDGKLVDVSETEQSAMYFGTGFFVSEDGKLITNLHIAKPWLFDEMSQEIESYYKKQLQIIANLNATSMPEIPIGAYVSEVKVEGKLKFIGLIPNCEDFDNENFIKCKILSAGDDKNIDVALIRTVSRKLPANCSYVKSKSILITDEDLKVGSHVYTLGFPAGLSLQDIGSNEVIKAIGHEGSIIQNTNNYSFGHDAPSEHGASGSPIFNKKGKLIGVLNAGYEKKQGFNYGIKAKYVMSMLDNYQTEENKKNE